jgi:hypothetical protein
MKKYTFSCFLSVLFLFSCSILSNKSDKASLRSSVSGSGKIIETLVSKKKVVTKMTADAKKLTKLDLGSFIEVDMDSADLEGVNYEIMDVYMIRCLEGGTMPCHSLDWALCPSSGCPTPSRVGEK